MPSARPCYFNPLSPHGERHGLEIRIAVCSTFQSTLPAWGETAGRRGAFRSNRNFNPLSPHGERRAAQRGHQPVAISIHSPRMGRDTRLAFSSELFKTFQSTLPAWGETRIFGVLDLMGQISIHSPRMGRDEDGAYGRRAYLHFNPLSPHGERHEYQRYPGTGGHISIHSPRMGRDEAREAARSRGEYFNPLSPHGERPHYTSHHSARKKFQSTLPAWGET